MDDEMEISAEDVAELPADAVVEEPYAGPWPKDLTDDDAFRTNGWLTSDGYRFVGERAEEKATQHQAQVDADSEGEDD